MTKLYFSGTTITGTSAYAYFLLGMSKRIGIIKGTRIEAEYTALVRGLESALELDLTKVTVLGPRLVIDQINGDADIKSAAAYSLYNKVIELLSKFRKVDLSSVSKERNKAYVFSTQALVDFFEGKAVVRSKKITDRSIKKIESLKYKVHGNTVDIGNQTCTCVHFSRTNIPELKKLGIAVRCEHIFAVERFLSM